MTKKTEPIFVFGSNLLGIHRSGAAKDAIKQYGAIYGQGIGIQGNSYAIPTKKTPWESLPLNEIRLHVIDFLDYAHLNSRIEFNVTRIGCGLAGYTDKDIAPMFYGAPDNCLLHHSWYDIHKTMAIVGGSTNPDFEV